MYPLHRAPHVPFAPRLPYRLSAKRKRFTTIPSDGGVLVSKPSQKSEADQIASQLKLIDGADKMLAAFGVEDAARLEEPLKIKKVAERTGSCVSLCVFKYELQ